MDLNNNEKIKTLAIYVFSRLKSIEKGEESDLYSVVGKTIDFSIKNSIPAEVLLEGFNTYFKNDVFSAAFVYAATAAGIATGKIKSIACCNAGVALYRMGLRDEAARQYELALIFDPYDVTTNLNYGILLEEMGRNKEAKEHFRIVKAHKKTDTA
jgi:tetratricopeptide (TPR) repeat protein